jgi:hypothetical protein
MTVKSPRLPEPPTTEAEDITSHPRSVNRWLVAGGVVTALLLLWFLAAGEPPAEGAHLGFWSVLPP